MRLAAALAIALFGGAVSIHAQDPPSTPSPIISSLPLLDVGSSEWMVTAGPAFGVRLFKSAQGHRYFLPSISWGRVLSGPIGPSVLRGRFEWALELVPLFEQYAPDDTYGIGVAPLVWRWNFESQGRLIHFAELAGGGLWTRSAIPATTTSANFTAHVSYGVRYYFQPRLAFVGSYRLHHISNGNRLTQNPGVNAHVFQAGVSVLRPR